MYAIQMERRIVMARRIRRLTPTLLKRMVIAEKKRMLENLGEETPVEKAAKETEEVDAGEFADSIEQDIDWMKALNIKESKLKKRLKRISEVKKKLRGRIIRRI